MRGSNVVAAPPLALGDVLPLQHKAQWRHLSDLRDKSTWAKICDGREIGSFDKHNVVEDSIVDLHRSPRLQSWGELYLERDRISVFVPVESALVCIYFAAIVSSLHLLAHFTLKNR